MGLSARLLSFLLAWGAIIALVAGACTQRPAPAAPGLEPTSPTPTSRATAQAPTPATQPAGTPQPVGFELDLVIDPPGSGFVGAIPPFGPYPAGSRVTLSVIAPRVPPYVFSHWGGDASSSEGAVTVLMDSDKRVVARFVNRFLTPTPSAEE